MLEQYNKVLSIQSHVVSGYVGNKSATFPLQVLGFEVDAINSVQFSNHTGYGYWKGQVLSDKDLSELIDGLKYNKLDYYTHLLTGYVGNPSFLAQIAELSKYLKSVNPNLIFVCDPVMGDNGQMYVPKELLPIYKNLIIPLADIITPNQYEVELLTGYCIKTIDDAWTAIENFHLRGVKTVVVSSTDLGNKDYLLGLGSSNIDGKNTKITVKIPKFPVNFTGTGDLFAALLLAWMQKTNNDLKISIEKTIATMQSVLNLTIKYSKDNSNKSSMGNMELKLIQSKNAIENPQIVIEAEVIKKTTKECN